ncbi:MAG: hypothetical protein B7Z02_12120 [Rhodobacterales bacterium 32-67-9]|nr:MAG: hypothetical protein B7Z02_12120 [Rhodobacterales bacterium 32-67-9]
MLCRSRLGLILAAAVAVTGAVSTAPRADYVGTFVWTGTSPKFGGFSALDLRPDGLGFVAVSDSAAFYGGRFSRGPSGAVVAVGTEPPVIPLSLHGTPVQDPMDDAEGVAFAPDGGLYVSYETENRIVRYGPEGRKWLGEDWPTLFKGFEVNFGIEALAIDAAGTLYAMPERPIPRHAPIPVFRGRDGVWDQPFTLRRDGGWLPVGADFGPDGRLYLLERDYWPLIGFMSRVRRITFDGDHVTEDEVLVQTPAGTHDNLEGLAVWQDAEGAIRLTMISDDNFLPSQRTEIVDYRVTE